MGARSTKPSRFKRHRYPDDVIRCVVDWYFIGDDGSQRLANACARRGLRIPDVTILRWTRKFGPSDQIERRLSLREFPPRWDLSCRQESANGEIVALWRASSSDGLLLDWIVAPPDDRPSAERLLGLLMAEARGLRTAESALL